MKNQKTILYMGIIGVSLLLSYILFSPSENRSRNSSRDLDASAKSYPSGRDALIADGKDSSLFDSQSGFLDFSKGQSPVGGEKTQPTAQTPVHDTAGISPEERARRRELVIQKFEHLAEKFPNNRYLPRKRSPEEEAEFRKTEENMGLLLDRIVSGDNLTPNERAYFYNQKQLESQEKLEILEYANKQLVESGYLPQESQEMVKERMASIQARLKTYQAELQSATQEGGSPSSWE